MTRLEAGSRPSHVPETALIHPMQQEGIRGARVTIGGTEANEDRRTTVAVLARLAKSAMTTDTGVSAAMCAKTRRLNAAKAPTAVAARKTTTFERKWKPVSAEEDGHRLRRAPCRSGRAVTVVLTTVLVL